MLIIHPAETRDLQTIWALNNAYLIPTEPEERLQSVLAKGKAWTAEWKGHIIGALVGKIKFEIPYVHSVSVHPLHRGKGVATKLFTAFEDGFSGGQYWLQVSADNPAQKLYFDLGYRVGGFDEHFYGRGKHALCMYKSLKV